METFEEFMTAMKALREENEKGFAELREQQKENAKEWAELREQQKENAKEWAELRELQKKYEEKRDKEFAKRDKELEKLEKFIGEVSKNVAGIAGSNGKLAEDYFFNSLEESKTLGGVHFDAVERNLKNSIPLKDGKTLDGEYDIALINKDSLGIVEVKYCVERKDIENLVNKQVVNFKTLFPMYANYKFYLGIGGLSFDKQAEDAAKKLGVGILKLNGDAVEINDKNLKVY